MPDSHTTPRVPEYSNVKPEAEQLIALLPMTIRSKDWYLIINVLTQSLQTHFVLGMQEARERTKHDPTLAN
jgi:hypothetical protein